MAELRRLSTLNFIDRLLRLFRTCENIECFANSFEWCYNERAIETVDFSILFLPSESLRNKMDYSISVTLTNRNGSLFKFNRISFSSVNRINRNHNFLWLLWSLLCKKKNEIDTLNFNSLAKSNCATFLTKHNLTFH